MLTLLCGRSRLGSPRLIRGAIIASVLPLLIVLSGSAYRQTLKGRLAVGEQRRLSRLGLIAASLNETGRTATSAWGYAPSIKVVGASGLGSPHWSRAFKSS